MSAPHLLVEFLLLAGAAAGAGCWIAAARRLVAGQALLPPEARRDPPWALVDLLVTLFLELSALEVVRAYLLSPGTSFEELAPRAQAAFLLASSLGTLAAVGLSVVWVVGRCGADLLDLGIDSRRLAADLKLGIVAFLMVAPVVYGIQWVLVQWMESKHPLLELLKQHPDPRLFSLSALAAVLVAPIAEEYLFRVLLQGWLERLPSLSCHPRLALLGGRLDPPSQACPAGPDEGVRLPAIAPDRGHPAADRLAEDEPAAANPDASPAGGSPALKADFGPREPPNPPVPLWPVFVSSALFATAHWSHGPDPVPLFVLAVALGILYQRTHRVVPCIVVHVLLNGCSLAGLWLYVHRGGG